MEEDVWHLLAIPEQTKRTHEKHPTSSLDAMNRNVVLGVLVSWPATRTSLSWLTGPSWDPDDEPSYHTFELVSCHQALQFSHHPPCWSLLGLHCLEVCCPQPILKFWSVCHLLCQGPPQHLPHLLRIHHHHSFPHPEMLVHQMCGSFLYPNCDQGVGPVFLWHQSFHSIDGLGEYVFVWWSMRKLECLANLK